MAPSSSRKRARSRPRRKTRKTHHKKRLVKTKKASLMEEQDVPPSSSTTTTTTTSSNNNCLKIDGIDFEAGAEVSTSACSTPKAERFRIPEIVTCPPAPKKQRVIPNCSLQRTPIAFFAPPDLELFFFLALRDISV